MSYKRELEGFPRISFNVSDHAGVSAGAPAESVRIQNAQGETVLSVEYAGNGFEATWETDLSQEDYFAQVGQLLSQLRSEQTPMVKGEEKLSYWQVDAIGGKTFDRENPWGSVTDSLHSLKDQVPEANASGLRLQTPYGAFFHFTELDRGRIVTRVGIEASDSKSTLMARFVNNLLREPLPESFLAKQLAPRHKVKPTP